MTLNSYDLKAKLEEKTTAYLQRQDQQDFLVLRRHCLELKPIQAVVEILSRELNQVWASDLEYSQRTLTTNACEAQKTSDALEETRDSACLATNRQALSGYQSELDGALFHSGITAQKKAKEDKIKQKQSKMDELTKQMRMHPSNRESLLTEEANLSKRKRELQRELADLSVKERRLESNIIDCKRVIQSCEERAKSRLDRKKARQAGNDLGLLQLSTSNRQKLRIDISSMETERSSKRNKLLVEGKGMSFGVYLSILEGQLASKFSADQIALREIIEQVHLHLRWKEAVAEAQSRLGNTQQKLRGVTDTRFQKQQEVAEACRKIALQVEDNSPDAISKGFKKYYNLLSQYDVALKTKLQSIPLYIGVSFVLGLALSVATVFVGTAFGTMVPIVLGIAAFLSIVVGIERSVRYCKIQEKISNNDKELAQYAQAHEYILLTIPQLTRDIALFNAEIFDLSEQISAGNRKAEEHLNIAQSINNVGVQPSAPPEQATYSSLWQPADGTPGAYVGEVPVAELVLEDNGMNGYAPLGMKGKKRINC